MINPYAPPQGPHPHHPPPHGTHQASFAQPQWEAYASGADLVITRNAPLPEVCMKCGVAQPGLVRRSQSFTWVPGWTYLTFGLGVVIGLVFVLIFQKNGHLVLPLCPSCNGRWKGAVAARVLSVFGFLALLLGLPMLTIATRSSKHIGIAFLAGLVLGIGQLVAVVYAVVKPRTIWPRSMTDLHMTLARVHPEAVAAAQKYAEMYSRR